MGTENSLPGTAPVREQQAGVEFSSIAVIKQSIPVVLNLWATTPSEENDLFAGVSQDHTAIYIMMHTMAKLQL